MLALKISVYTIVFFFVGIFLFGVLVGSLAKNPKRKIPIKKKTIV